MRDVDYTATITFLRKFFALTGGRVELRVFGNNGGSGPRIFLEGKDAAERAKEFCQRNDNNGVAVCFGCATRLDNGSKQGERKDLSEVGAVWIDIDCDTHGLDVEEVAGILDRSGFPPSICVFSGHGVHAYWLLAEPIDVEWTPGTDDPVKAEFDAFLRRLAAAFCGDQKCCVISQIMRLPGTRNSKDLDNIKQAVVLFENDSRYSIAELDEALSELGGQPLIVSATAPATVSPIPFNQPNTGDQGVSGDPLIQYGATGKGRFDLSRLDTMVFKHPDASMTIHEVRVPAIGHMVGVGYQDQEIFDKARAATEAAVLRAAGNPVAEREIARWNWRQEDETIWEEIRGAHKKGWAPKHADEPDLPEGVIELRPGQQARPDDDPLPAKAPAQKPIIYIKAGHLAETTDVAERLLCALGAPFYSRTSKLMRPVVEEDWAADGIKTKVARLTEVSPAFMRDYLSRLGSWFRHDARSRKWVPCDPPKDVAETVLARQGEWRMLPVAGVITTPTIRPDGSILREEGYDPATRLILLSPPALPAIPDRPSRGDAEAALACLSDLLTEFCFVDEPSRSVALSALITPVVRGALPVVPAHVMKAPVAGSGKSYLVDISAVISTGQKCPVISSGKSEEEQEKRIGAVLMGGQSIVSIDNLNGELRGDALCQMVERPLVQIRILGKSELMRVETRATLFATGNNIVVVGDMVRRTLVSSMDANVENPELREFKQKPLAMVLADRGKYIAAVLTIVRAYQCAGYPGALSPLASYDSWSLMVRSALVWLGCADPAKTIETSRETDPDMIALIAVVEAWSQAVNIGEKKTAGELIAISQMQEKNSKDEFELVHPMLAEALEMVARGRRGLDAAVLGNWLSGQQNRVIGAVKIVADGSKTHARRWSLSTAVRVG